MQRHCDDAAREAQRLVDLAGRRRDAGGAEYARRAGEQREVAAGATACLALMEFCAGDATTVDLHGLTVPCARAVVAGLVDCVGLGGWRGREEVVVVTGRGSHSVDGPRLRPAVGRDLARMAGPGCPVDMAPFGSAGFRLTRR